MNASELIDQQIANLSDWRGAWVARLRQIILEADPDVVEEWKWDTGVWSHGGLLCSVGVFKEHVKLNFFRGAGLPDPKGIFNAGLQAKKTRSIDFYEGDPIDEASLREMVRAALNLNASKR